MQKIVLVGKMYNISKNGGPTAVLFSLKNAFKEKQIPFSCKALNEKTNKLNYMVDLFKLLFCSNAAINVHVNGFLIAFVVYWVSKVNHKCDYYLTIHGIYSIQTRYGHERKKIYVFLEKYLYNRFPNLICVSELCKEKVLENFNPNGNIYVIGNGTTYLKKIPEKVFFSNNKYHTFVFMGGFQEIKGISFVLKVFKKILLKNPDYYLHIYGHADDNEISQFRAFVKKNNLTNNILYKGMARGSKEINAIYQKSEFHLSFSKFDTYNVTILEAMNNGCINITNTCSGSAYLVKDQVTGYIIPDHYTVDEVADRIESIITELEKNPSRYYAMRLAGRKIAKENDWETIAEQYRNVCGINCREPME